MVTVRQLPFVCVKNSHCSKQFGVHLKANIPWVFCVLPPELGCHCIRPIDEGVPRWRGVKVVGNMVGEASSQRCSS